MMKNIIAIIILITIDTFQTHDTPVKISRMVYYILSPVNRRRTDNIQMLKNYDNSGS